MGKNLFTCNKLFAISGWLFLLLGLVSSLDAQIILRTLQFENNQYLSKQKLTEIASVNPGEEYYAERLASISSRLVEYYHSEGFYSFRVDSMKSIITPDSQDVDIIFFLWEGYQTLVSDIKVTGNSNISGAELLSLVETSKGEPLHSSRLESDITSILKLYSNRGFPFAKIHCDSIGLDSAGLQINLVVEENSRVFLTEIQIEGTTTTKADVILREVRLHKNETFSDERLERIQHRLQRLQLFSYVAEPQLYVLRNDQIDSLSGGLLLRVKEGDANSFDGIVGYVPSIRSGSKGYFTGDIFVSFRNLFGTARKAMVKWKKENEITQELELQYKEPWLFRIPLNIGISFFQRKQDSSYVKNRIECNSEYAITDELSLAGKISSESVYPSENVQQFSVFESNTMFFGGEILYDTRDNLQNTQHGVRYSTSAQQGTKNITGPKKYLDQVAENNFSIQKYSVDAEFYISTFFRQVVMIGVHGKQISSSRLEVSDLYQFGGTNSLRGYRENQFYASTIAWTNIEYRFLTGRASSLYGFVDGGYFSRSNDALRDITGQEESLYGYGIGARVETGLGIMNFSFAFGKGDSFSQGKIHVGIINEF